MSPRMSNRSAAARSTCALRHKIPNCSARALQLYSVATANVAVVHPVSFLLYAGRLGGVPPSETDTNCHEHMNINTGVSTYFSGCGHILGKTPTHPCTYSSGTFDAVFYRVVGTTCTSVIHDSKLAGGGTCRTAMVYEPTKATDKSPRLRMGCVVEVQIDRMCVAPDGLAAIVYSADRDVAHFVSGAACADARQVIVSGTRAELELFADCMFVSDFPFAVALESSRFGVFVIYPDGTCSESYYPMDITNPDTFDMNEYFEYVDVYVDGGRAELVCHSITGRLFRVAMTQLGGKVVWHNFRGLN